MCPTVSPELSAADAIERHVRERVAGRTSPLVVGICGAQGSGKTTVAASVVRRLEADGIAAAALSLDDLYLTRGERERLARTVHPLLRVRGVPGTHDVALGISVLDALEAGRETLLPRFDKASDDRAAEGTAVSADVRVVLWEGWCIGAVAEPDAALGLPVNALEAREDADGGWRRWVNRQLAGPYQCLWARIDSLVLLRAPSFDVVRGWRIEQEQALRRATGGGMTDQAVGRFVEFYERLTRHILREMPGRCDLMLTLDERRRIVVS